MKKLIIVFLFSAVFILKAEKVELFKDKECRNAYLYHFLNRSCANGDVLGVKILLSQGANPDGKGYKKYPDCVNIGFEFSSPLYQATEEGYTKIVEILLIAGATPNVLEGEGYSPLISAVDNENAKIIKLLLKHGAKVFLKNQLFDPIKLAKKKNNMEIVKLLKKHVEKKIK